MTTGQRIQQARRRAGLSQRELGEKMGLSASMIGQWENDLRKPKYETLKRLADALDVYVYDLSAPEDTAARVRQLEDFLLSDEIDYTPHDMNVQKNLQRINEALDKLNPDGQQKAVERVEELTEIPRYQKETETSPQAPQHKKGDATPEE